MSVLAVGRPNLPILFPLWALQDEAEMSPK